MRSFRSGQVIMTRMRRDELSIVLLKSQPVPARHYSIRQLLRSTSASSNRRVWITGYIAAGRTSTNTAAIPVRSGNSSHPPGS